ncbi:MAG: hypothetical protein AABW89_00365 [Nanoarchaeota archaeon]
MTNKKIKIYQTKTYLDSLNDLGNTWRIAVEKKVNSLITNQDIAKPMSYQHGGFCEIKVGSKYRVYCIRIENSLVVAFVLGPVLDHDENYTKSKEYKKLFERLEKIKEEFKDKI